MIRGAKMKIIPWNNLEVDTIEEFRKISDFIELHNIVQTDNISGNILMFILCLLDRASLW